VIDAEAPQRAHLFLKGHKLLLLHSTWLLSDGWRPCREAAPAPQNPLPG